MVKLVERGIDGGTENLAQVLVYSIQVITQDRLSCKNKQCGRQKKKTGETLHN